ncbi:MAG: (2Fe-2S)-binding protein, partial [Hyphomicrobiaceae bacterium]
GFCTPGMLASALSYIEGGGSSERDSIRAHLSGNFCRCTGYQAIVDAVAEVIEARAQS